ncbi:MAG: apolipoprotein N-acyltransferase [Candidatus Omnitrophica bacterium]|nr:apolipoprotein N-acyltransferase [Candidatus Omnitrophota bacterium]
MNFILSILSGVMLVLAFPDHDLWLLSWLAFIPLFAAIEGGNARERFLRAYITGIIFFSGTIYWLTNVTILGTALLILYLSLYFGLFGIIFNKGSRGFQLFILPAAWVVLEYIRSHLFSGFGWALLGYSQYLNLPAIQIADVTGAWGVSFIIMMFNAALWQAVSRRCLKAPAAPLLIILCVLFYGFFKLDQPLEGRSVRAALIQGNIPQSLKWQPGQEEYIFNRYFTLSLHSCDDKPDIIIWPESAVVNYLDLDAPLRGQNFFREIAALTREMGVPILFGAVSRGKEGFFNSALFLQGGELKGQYNKIHLVPFGEYIPLRKYLPFLETVVPIGDFSSGSEPVVFTSAEGAGFSVLICFEDTLPALSRGFVNRGAEFLVNITNDAWFGKSGAPYQHLQASVFRAVENRRPLARAANTGVSAFIDQRGRIVDTVNKAGKEIFVEGFKVKDIILSSGQKSVYTRVGDIFVLGCLILCCAHLVLGWKRKK